MFVRYFAETSDTPTGKLARAYMAALVAAKTPTRLVTTSVAALQLDEAGASSDPWAPYRDYLIAVVPNDYVNVVCCDPRLWGMYLTAKVRNVLIALEDPPPYNDRHLHVATLYGAIMVPSAKGVELWRYAIRSTAHGGGDEPMVHLLSQRARDFHAAYVMGP